MQYDQPVKSKDPLNRSGPVQLQADWACMVRAQGAVSTMSIKNQSARIRVGLGKFCNCQGYLDASESSIPE